jgi:hypothetical protein
VTAVVRGNAVEWGGGHAMGMVEVEEITREIGN